MRRLLFLQCVLVAVAASAAVAPAAAKTNKPAADQHMPAVTKSTLTAAQIIAKNVAARGGLKAWRAVQTLTLTGRLEAGGKKNETLPFVMKMKRPHMSRLEIAFQDQTAFQVFDGEQGWKVRPFLGRDDPEPYTSAEKKEAAGWQELDGPLVDYAKKGTKVSVIGMQAVEGHRAYLLKLTLKNGEERHVWIDAKSFLERKIDGEPRKLDGKMRDVAVYYRDYTKEHGLTMPRVLETVVDGGLQPHKMYIDHVAINQPMENALFAKPGQQQSGPLANISGQPIQPAVMHP